MPLDSRCEVVDMVDRLFIRLDASNNVIHGFSDDFESPQIGDIQISGSGRGFNIELFDINGKPRWKWNGSTMVLRTDDEVYTLDEVKTIQKELIRERARYTFTKRYDSMDTALAISQVLTNGTKYQNLVTDITNWAAARKTALDAVDAATTKAAVRAIKFQVPG